MRHRRMSWSQWYMQFHSLFLVVFPPGFSVIEGISGIQAVVDLSGCRIGVVVDSTRENVYNKGTVLEIEWLTRFSSVRRMWIELMRMQATSKCV
jgi:hypothetical protein